MREAAEKAAEMEKKHQSFLAQQAKQESIASQEKAEKEAARVARIEEGRRLANAIRKASVKLSPDEREPYVALRIMSLGGSKILPEQVAERRKDIESLRRRGKALIHPDRLGRDSTDAFTALESAYEMVNRIAEESRLADAITEAAKGLFLDEPESHVALRVMSHGGPLILLEQVEIKQSYIEPKWQERSEMLDPNRC